MKTMLIASSLLVGLVAYAERPNEKAVTTAECSGPILGNHSSHADRGEVKVTLKRNVISVEANTSLTLKNNNRPYSVVEGKSGWVDSKERINNASVYGVDRGYAVSLTKLGYDAYARKFRTNIYFENEYGTYYGSLKCKTVE